MSFAPIPLSPTTPTGPSSPPPSTSTNSFNRLSTSSPLNSLTTLSSSSSSNTPSITNSNNRLSTSPLNPMNSVNASLNNPNNRRPNYENMRDSSSSISSLSKYHSRRESEVLDPSSIAVLTGMVGGSFGRYPRNSVLINEDPSLASYNPRNSLAESSDVAIDILAPSPDEYLESEEGERMRRKEGVDSTLLWGKGNEDVDDYLHDPNEELDRHLDRQWGAISWKGVLNSTLLVIIVVVLIGLFAGWPIYRSVVHGGWGGTGLSTTLGWNTGGINASGQVPITLAPTLIDKDTPSQFHTKVGIDGDTYNLVFSDEFEKEGRTFWPGDDPFWEAQDLWYWPTVDLEWYDPDQITTKNGKLEITLAEDPLHNLTFRSGMLQSWNKLCFTGGILEMSISLPGSSKAQGFWPAAWTLGNLARAGYGATSEGVWPYTYNSCDVGTLPNQTNPDGLTPTAAKHSGDPAYGGELSWLGGQRLSACTCDGEDHPGPNVGVGRGAPEIDLIEAKIGPSGVLGAASQSIQLAPMDDHYAWVNTTPAVTFYNNITTTYQNIWRGSVNQESMSVDTIIGDTCYNDTDYATFAFEYEPGPSGKITWSVKDRPSWQLTSAAMPPNPVVGIGQRLVAAEPMSININLAISEKFQPPEWGKLAFPAVMRVDYVRLWQKKGQSLGCDPSDYPTSEYINRHPEAYQDPLQTTWTGIPGYTKPKNKLAAGGCA